MKNIFIAIISILIISCSQENIETENLRINHYQQMAVGEGRHLVFLVQEGNSIGSESWTYLYNNIEGFDYKLGYVYSLNVKERTVENPPADGSSIKYILEEVVSKEKVDEDVSFEITLKSVRLSPTPSFVTGDLDSGFKLLYTTTIDCGSLCDELSQSLETKNELVGIFNHIEPGAIKLVELKKE